MRRPFEKPDPTLRNLQIDQTPNAWQTAFQHIERQINMNTIREIERVKSPANLPQSLAWDGSNLWFGSLETKRIYKLDTEKKAVIWETEAPGSPWGMVSIGDEFRLICGETSNDDRYVRRLIPGQGFAEDFRFMCPDNTGSQLSFDGQTLHLSQWYNQVVLALDENLQPTKTYKATRGICGQTWFDGKLYILNTADEEKGDYFISRIDPKDGSVTDLAMVPFRARALAQDGERFWTNHREAHEIVAFEI